MDEVADDETTRAIVYSWYSDCTSDAYITEV
jgi:hypothetical protein